MASRIPFPIRKDSARAGKRQAPGSPSTSLPGPSTAEQPPDKRLCALPRPPQPSSAKQPICRNKRLLRPASSSRSLLKSSSAERLADKRKLPNASLTHSPGCSSAQQPTGKRLPSDTHSPQLPEHGCIAQPVDQRLTPSSSSPSLLGPAQPSSAEQSTDNWLLAEQSHTPRTDGRLTGHHFANNVANDNSRVHNGNNHNSTHYHNYQTPDPDNEIPHNLKDAIAKNKVEIYLDHVMKTLSFERMELREGAVEPALVNTCQWLLTSSEYINWRDPHQIDDHHGFMWIKSKAVAGKSTTMKFLLESTRSQRSGDTVISFFFNARGDEMERTLNGLYRHLLHQLLSSVSRLKYAQVDAVKKIAKQGWQLQPLKDLLRRVVLDLQSERFICFIDALDETSEDEIRELIDFFEELGNDVVAKIIGFGQAQTTKRWHLVQEKAQGVFLWVVLVTQILKKDYDRGDIHKARGRLESIPPDLHSLFHEMIYRNVEDSNDNRYFFSLLQWIAFARRPLTPQDLYYAVRSEDPEFDISQFWQTKGVDLETMKLFIPNCSKGLAELTTSRRRPTIQFIHESVRDFLDKTGFNILTPGRGVPLFGFAHNNLKQCCLRWISNIMFKQLWWLGRDDVPLISYSVGNMIEHAEQACRSGIPQKDFVESFPIEVWTFLARSVSDRYMPREQSGSPASLTEILAYHHATAPLAIELGRIGLRLLSCQYETALRIALSQGDMTTFELLLRKASPSHSLAEEQTRTLSYAVKERDDQPLQLMSKYGKHFVPPNGSFTITPQAAHPEDAYRLVLAYIRMMSNAKTIMVPADQVGLLQACLQGNETSVKAYLRGKARPDVDVNDRSQSHAVYPRRCDRVSQMLLEHGADRDAAQGRRPYPVLPYGDWML